MFKKVIQFLKGDFAITSTVRNIHEIVDKVRKLPIEDAVTEATQVISDDTLFAIFEGSQKSLPDALPQYAKTFFDVYSHLICLRNDVELDVSLFTQWNSDNNYMQIGQSNNGVALLLELHSDHVLEVYSSQLDTATHDILPSVFHWIVLQHRLDNLSE